ncbi:MAG: GNAT family N-acetyltransferase [Coriobacteriia bacterium]|nr:GNAT family N-acetyltransferase [Coriobacteriia bacterium]
MVAAEFVWIAATDPRMAEVHALRHEVLFAPFGLPRDDDWDDEGADRRHLVALAGGRVVGYLNMIVEPAGSGHVRQVSVSGAFQGTGIGRALMLEAEAEATRIGLSLVWLNARVSAEGFYHRLGYRTTSAEPFPSGRTRVPHVRMERALLSDTPRKR